MQVVLDESGSVVSPDNHAATVRDAAEAFVRALEGTGSDLAITAFQRTARQLIGYTPATAGNQNSFFAQINGRATGRPGGTAPLGYNPESPPRVTNNVFGPSDAGLINATNWDDAFAQVLTTGAPDLVVFITDGDPTTYNTVPFPARPPVGTNTGTETPATGGAVFDESLRAGIRSANRVKATTVMGAGGANPPRSRIFAVGVGPAAANTTAGANSRLRLSKVSGTNVFPASTATALPTTGITGTDDFTDGDFAAVGFGDLTTSLTEIVSQLCGGTLTITKFLPDVPTQVAPTDAWHRADGWTFRTTLSGGGHTWVTPDRATNDQPDGPTAELQTGHDPPGLPGIAQFEWNLDPGVRDVEATVHRIEKNDFTFVRAQCDRDGEPVPEEPLGIGRFTLGEDDWVTCSVYNQPRMATLTLVKSLDPSDDPGRFNLHIGDVVKPNVGDGGHLTQTVLPGNHTIMETPGIEEDGTETDLANYDSSLSCYDLTNQQPLELLENTGTSGVVHLAADQQVICTITNTSTRFGQITVTKNLIPADDDGMFQLHIGDEVSDPVGHGESLTNERVPFGTHVVTETAASGTNLGEYNISTTCVDENTGAVVAHNADGPQVSVDLSRQHHHIQCTITNHRPGVKTGHLKVVKHLVPHADVGTFNLLIGGHAFATDVGHNGTTGRLEVELGSHTVTESGAEGTHLSEFSISTTCVDKGHGGHTVAHNAHGPRVSVHVNRTADDIVCTITNRRIAPPPGGGDGIQVPPGPDPHLSVVKTMPARARVGEVVPITITVHNLGHGTARGVRLHENRPAGLRIVRVANRGRIRNGTAVWRLGNLGPGESRTVHATARVLRTGSHPDRAVATALNADPALSNAFVRAARTAARRPAPQFTG